MAREYRNLPKHLGHISFKGEEYEIHTIHEHSDGKRVFKMFDVNEGKDVEMEYTPLETSELEQNNQGTH